MKTLLCLLLCLTASIGIFGQTSEAETTEEVAVEEITLARDDGNGKPGEISDKFFTTDIPIHCLIQLASTKTATVKMNFVTVNAAGFKAGTSIVTVSYKTNGSQNRVMFRASPDGVWITGKYRVDVLLDGKFARGLEFEIQKSPSANGKDAPKTTAAPASKKKRVRKS